MFLQNTVNSVSCACTLYSGVTYGYYAVYPAPSNTPIVCGTNYTISSKSSTGYPQITYTDSTTVNLTYDDIKVLLSEAYRRIYPVICDTKTIKLTDGTHNTTLTSTSSGYSIGQMSDVAITTPYSTQVL